jgi:hypothetical protein
VYSASLDTSEIPEADNRSKLNDKAAVVGEVIGRPRVLLVSTDTTAALSRALGSNHLSVDTVTPNQLPASSEGLRKYDLVVFSDIPARWISPAQEAAVVHFVKELGYRGVFDCGYRYDPRDGVYKMLDVNPRVGLNFRQCVGRGDLDVVRAMYLDLTAQEVPAGQPAEGRVWWVEDYDIRAGMAHVRERSLTARAWMGSLRQVDEPAWFARDDLAPFRRLVRQLVAKASRRILTRTGLGAWRGQGRPGKDASGPVRYSTRASTRC